MTGHRHVHQVAVFQIDLRDATSALHHDGIIARGQTVEGRAYFLAVIYIQTIVLFPCLLVSLSSPIIIRIFVADGFAVEDDLRGMVTLGLQQQGIHIRMTGDACCLGLNSLGSAYLQTLRSGVGVERHVLSLEGSRVVAVLLEDATEGRSYDALANVATRSCEHNGVEV